MKAQSGIKNIRAAWEKDIFSWRDFLRIYSLAFLAIVAGICLVLIINGKSLIHSVDALTMVYTAFVWVGRWIRGVVQALVCDHQLVIPQWSTDAGYGSDLWVIIGTNLFNPFYAISALVPEQFSEYVFNIIVILRLYAAGLAFELFAWARGLCGREGVIGAIVYAFSGIALIVYTQPALFDAFILFPLLLWAADRLFAGKPGTAFSLVVGLVFVTNFYTGYMMCILLLGYCLIRYFLIEGRHSAVGLLRLFLKFVVFLVLGMALAAITLLPVIGCLLGMDRLAVERYVPLLYPLNYYVGLLTGFISYAYTYADSYIGLNALAPLALFLLCVKCKGNRENKGLLVAFCCLTVIYLVPQLGSAMNGFQYVTNRWSWAYDLCCAFVLAKMLAAPVTLTRRQCTCLLAIVGAYGALALVLFSGSSGTSFFAQYAILVAGCMYLVFRQGFDARRVAFPALVAACVSCFAIAYCFLSPLIGNGLKDMVGVGKAYVDETVLNSSQLVEDLAEDAKAGEWRYDSSASDVIANNTIFREEQGINYYYNMYNSAVDSFHKALGVPWAIAFRYSGVYSRSALDALFGVKYFVSDAGGESSLPYQFASKDALAVSDETGAEIRESSLSLPLAFTYGRTMSRSAFDSLNMVQRQEALLQAVVLEDGVVSDEESDGTTLAKSGGTDERGETSVGTTSFELNYAVSSPSASEKFSCTTSGDAEGSCTVDAKSAGSMTLECDIPAGCEAYLCIEGLNFEAYTEAETVTASDLAAMSFSERLVLSYRSLFQTEGDTAYFDVACSDVTLEEGAYNSRSHLYSGLEDYALNLGYSKDERHNVTITFTTPALYTFDSIKVIAQPMDAFESQVQALAAGGATDVVYEDNTISGTVTVDAGNERESARKEEASAELHQPGADDSTRYLFVSVPYSSGWTAYVDGNPVEVERANIGFMAIKVPAGTHSFSFEYRTPYLKVGALITLCAAVVLAVLAIGTAIRQKRTKTPTK